MYILNEDSRNDLVAKSKRSQKGFQRFKRRVKSRVATSTAEFNQINMNELFKSNILTVAIKVHGETDEYTVKISFGGILDSLKNELKRTNSLDLRTIIRALVNCFNREDVYINCSCPDFLYRFSYVSTKGKYKEGEPQLIPAKITNPDDTLGAGCKHTLLVLSNTSWLIKVASVIKNYITYMEKYRQNLYANVIYPAIYGKKYEEPVQLGIEDTDSDELESDENTLNIANKEAKERGRFKPGNKQGIRFAPKDTLNNQVSIEEEPIDEQ